MLIKLTPKMTETERITAENSNNQFLQSLCFVEEGTNNGLIYEKRASGIIKWYGRIKLKPLDNKQMAINEIYFEDLRIPSKNDVINVSVTIDCTKGNDAAYTNLSPGYVLRDGENFIIICASDPKGGIESDAVIYADVTILGYTGESIPDIPIEEPDEPDTPNEPIE